MLLDRNEPNDDWIATQGIWYGLGETRGLAVLDCLVTCAEALSLGVGRGLRILRDEVRQWWRDVFIAGDVDCPER